MAAAEGSQSDSIVRPDGSQLCLGDRLESEEHFATIRYIGPVTNTKGVWIGVEWDDPSRGKHDGSHEGVRYFTTSHPKSGSFIRSKKAELGVPFMAAVKDRYGYIDDDSAGVIAEDLYVLSAQNKATVVEMVGAKKVNQQQSKLNKLQEVVLKGMNVYGTHMSHDLQSLVPCIKTVDLSRNLLPSWKSVASITRQLPELRALNVSENKLEFPNKPSELAPYFSKIKCLYLNRMNYEWKQILFLMEMFTALEQLHVCFNCISSLSSTGSLLQRLTLLNLESNQLDSWAQVKRVGDLPCLETLILSDNKLPDIQFDDTPPAGTTNLFSTLKSLSINHNKISEWSSINELTKLRSLQDLRIKSNPLLDTASAETFRQLLIAKLPHLTICNRTEIVGEERKGAEIDYLKRFGPDWMKQGGHQDPNRNDPSKTFITDHPRYQTLVEKWGPPEDSEMEKKLTSLKSSLMPLKITCPDLPEKKTIQKKLLGSMTVQSLKALVHRLYKLDSEVNLTYISQQMPDKEIELDNEQQNLTYYSIEAGDTICVKVC